LIKLVIHQAKRAKEIELEPFLKPILRSPIQKCSLLDFDSSNSLSRNEGDGKPNVFDALNRSSYCNFNKHVRKRQYVLAADIFTVAKLIDFATSWVIRIVDPEYRWDSVFTPPLFHSAADIH